jgi:hypothetical protein
MRNLLAAVGLVFIVQAGYGLYSRFRELERENSFLRQASAQAKNTSKA